MNYLIKFLLLKTCYFFSQVLVFLPKVVSLALYKGALDGKQPRLAIFSTEGIAAFKTLRSPAP